MFWKKKARESDDDMTKLICSPYSIPKPMGYHMSESMLLDIEEEALKFTEVAVEHNLVDEFSVEEMSEENEFFIDRMIHNMFAKLLNYLKKQKIIKERQTIGMIRRRQRFLKKSQN